LAALLELISWEKAEELATQLRSDLSGVEPCDHVLQFADRERLAELDLDVRKFSAWSRVALSVENIIRGYVTAGTMKTMCVFCSAGLPRLFKIPEWHALLRRWDLFVDQPKYINVLGEHYTLMAPKHVATFQDVLRGEIEAALQGK
jgi:thioesterase domain-containing protein